MARCPCCGEALEPGDETLSHCPLCGEEMEFGDAQRSVAAPEDDVPDDEAFAGLPVIDNSLDAPPPAHAGDDFSAPESLAPRSEHGIEFPGGPARRAGASILHQLGLSNGASGGNGSLAAAGAVLDAPPVPASPSALPELDLADPAMAEPLPPGENELPRPMPGLSATVPLGQSSAPVDETVPAAPIPDALIADAAAAVSGQRSRQAERPEPLPALELPEPEPPVLELPEPVPPAPGENELPRPRPQGIGRIEPVKGPLPDLPPPELAPATAKPSGEVDLPSKKELKQAARQQARLEKAKAKRDKANAKKLLKAKKTGVPSVPRVRRRRGRGRVVLLTLLLFASIGVAYVAWQRPELLRGQLGPLAEATPITEASPVDTLVVDPTPTPKRGTKSSPSGTPASTRSVRQTPASRKTAAPTRVTVAPTLAVAPTPRATAARAPVTPVPTVAVRPTARPTATPRPTRAARRTPPATPTKVARATPNATATPRPAATATPAPVSSGKAAALSSAHALLKSGKYAKAARAYKGVLKDYNDPEAQYWLSVAYAYQGEDGKACRAIKAYLKEAPSGRYAKQAQTARANCD